MRRSARLKKTTKETENDIVHSISPTQESVHSSSDDKENMHSDDIQGPSKRLKQSSSSSKPMVLIKKTPYKPKLSSKTRPSKSPVKSNKPSTIWKTVQDTIDEFENDSDSVFSIISTSESQDTISEFVDTDDEIVQPVKRTKAPTAAVSVVGESTTAATVVETTAVVPRPTPKAKGKVVRPDFNVLHPDLVDVWDRLANEPLYDLSNKQTPEQLLVTLLPFQLQGLSWLQQQEKSRFKGGILADEMGMGKTIQMISLLVSKRVRRTLILCPTVAMNQWKNELMNRTKPNTFRVCLHHGPSRTTSQAELEKYDVVLTSYAILESGYRKQMYGTKEKGELVKRKSLLHKIHWGRIVLDEAHAIKDRSSSTAKAAFALQRDFQWSLSGTPLQNRVGELYSLIRLLNIYPYSFYFCRSCDCRLKEWHFSDRTYCDGCGHTTHQHFCWWNKEILKPIQDSGTEGNGLGAFKKLNTLLDRIMLRRTKVEKNDELGLPPRIVVSRRDYFNDAEEELYESLYTETTRTFNTYVQSGTVLNHYASIFSLLSRMRLAANHPELVTAKLAMKDSKFVCVVCHEEAEDPIASKCKHVFCREDAMQYLESVPDHEPINCPKCFHSLSIDLTQPAMDISDKKTMENQMSIVNQVDLKNWRSSTKIEALVEELNKLKMEDCTIKSIVFSQFTSFLDLVHWRLSRGGFNVVKLDGRMGPTQRANVIEKFTKDPTVTVFLISLKAGGIALNLTEASQVFVMDPWWNPAVEDQAMDRIHRLGQHRPIKITRMIIENSIESRILELQQKKKALFDSTVGKKLDSLSKLSQDDLRFLFVL